MINKMFMAMSILAAEGLDALENKIRFTVLLAFIAFVGIPVLKALFGKKDR